MWKNLAEARERFIGGTLQDVDTDVGPLAETTITDVRFDGTMFTIDGADYSCSINREYGLIGAEYGWFLVVAPGLRWRFKAKETN